MISERLEIEHERALTEISPETWYEGGEYYIHFYWAKHCPKCKVAKTINHLITMYTPRVYLVEKDVTIGEMTPKGWVPYRLHPIEVDEWEKLCRLAYAKRIINLVKEQKKSIIDEETANRLAFLSVFNPGSLPYGFEVQYVTPLVAVTWQDWEITKHSFIIPGLGEVEDREENIEFIYTAEIWKGLYYVHYLNEFGPTFYLSFIQALDHLLRIKFGKGYRQNYRAYVAYNKSWYRLLGYQFVTMFYQAYKAQKNIADYYKELKEDFAYAYQLAREIGIEPPMLFPKPLKQDVIKTYGGMAEKPEIVEKICIDFSKHITNTIREVSRKKMLGG